MTKLCWAFLYATLVAWLAPGAIARAQPASRAADEAALRQAGRDYLAALAQGDAKAIAEFWTTEGTYTDEHGQSSNARELAQKSFADGKADRPPPQVSQVTLRFVTSDVAVEDGLCESIAPGGSPQTGRFTALWVKQANKWKLDSLRETRSESPSASGTPERNNLSALEPLIGQWTGTSGKISMQCSDKWNSTKTFIHRDLAVSSDGQQVFGGTQEIGWDPAAQSIKSWTFNNDGSHSEGLWSIDGNSWIVVTSGMLGDGRVAANTQIFKFTDNNTLVWRLIDGQVGGQSTPKLEFKLTRTGGTK